MPIHQFAGKVAPASILVDVSELNESYYGDKPDVAVTEQRVSFGTSGHRGSSLRKNFNDDHIAAITQAVCEYRKKEGIVGPLFMGKDTHALSEPAHQTALEVFAANGVLLRIAHDGNFTPTPAISFAILEHNKLEGSIADGVVITPSHNPPEDGGFKYNPPHGGPADANVTSWVQDRANELLAEGLSGVKRFSEKKAKQSDDVQEHDFIAPYVEALASIVDMAAIKDAGLRIGVDPMGGAGIGYWGPIAERYGLNIDIVNTEVNPTFAFMTVDRDGKIRMDCSSPYAMASLVGLKDRYDIAFGNDTDFDRHGIVTSTGGLMNPNHYLSVAIEYLFENRPKWPSSAAIGKTLVSSAMIDRVVNALGAKLSEVPVGFKWFVQGLLTGEYAFGGEESAGASFLRHDGQVWTTDKDGFVMDLLAAEILAKTGRDPSERYADLAARFGEPVYERTQAVATSAQKTRLKNLNASDVSAKTLAGNAISRVLTHAPGNGAAIGGLKVETEEGWFAARPSGTEDIYKIYAESFVDSDHLARIQQEAQAIVDTVL